MLKKEACFLRATYDKRFILRRKKKKLYPLVIALVFVSGLQAKIPYL